MSDQRFDTGDAPHVMLKTCAQDVTIGSWTRQAVTFSGDAFTAESPEANLIIGSSTAPLTVQLPANSRLTLDGVAGSLTIKNVAGLIKIGQVQGDLHLKQVGNTQVDVVEGELQADNLNGPFHAAELARAAAFRNVGDVQVDRAQTAVSLRYVNGRITLGDVAGPLQVHTVSGSLLVQRCGAEAHLSNLGGQVTLPAAAVVWLVGGLVPGEHTITAQERIYVYWPSLAPLNLIATGSEIVSTLPLKQAANTVDDSQTTLTGYIKDRKTFLVLKAAGRIGLTTWDGSGVPPFAEADFLPPPPVVVTAEPPAPAAPAEPVEAAVARAVADVLNRLELELGPEWGRRFAALELEDQLTAAVRRELAAAAGTAAPLPAAMPPAASPGMVAFDQAETAVRHSLQKIEDGLAQARQKLAPPAAQEAAAVSAAAAEPPEAAADLPEPQPQPGEAAAQLRILDLLENGAISVDEASQLLQAVR